MKNKIVNISLILSLLFFTPSCNLFPEPEEPDYQAELGVLLPGTQYMLAYFNGTDYGRFKLIWMQQLAGVRGVHLNVDRYNLQPDHLQEVWDVYYKSIFPNFQLMFSHADKIDSKAYRGISRIMLALSLGQMTDAWGDIPYSSALNYITGFWPSYDGQGDIYQEILSLLDSGILDLAEALSGNGIKPGPGQDLYYGGDLNKWIRAANAVKLRYELRIAHRINNYEMLINNISSGNLFTGNHDDLEYHFIGNQGNPYHYYDNIVRNTRMGKYLVDKLKQTNDPRLGVFVRRSTHNNEYVGSAPAEANFNASFIGATVAAEKAPIYLLTYAEQKFIEAEVYYRAGQQTFADQAFEQAVKASLQKYGVSNAEWENQHATIDNVSLEQIISAKYVALFLNPEVWSDYRRTGFPQLVPYQIPPEEGQTPQIPRRFIYPTNETLYNSNHMPANVTIFSRMWWDISE